MIFIKRLPKIYQNTINKKINNNKNSYCIKCNQDNSDNRTDTFMDNISVNRVIDSLFNTTGYAFNIPIIIKTKSNKYDTSLIAKRNGYVLTLDHDKIKIDDIIFIQIKNP